MADSETKRPQSDDSQPSPTSDAVSHSTRSGINPNQHGQLSDDGVERRVFSVVMRDDVRNPRTSADKIDSNSDDDDYTSTSGSESDEEDDDDKDDDKEQDRDVKSDNDSHHSLPRVPTRQKPQIHRMEQSSDILSRLSAFLPQMKNANDELQREIEAGRAKELRLDEVDDQDDGQYIEMNLGLGVLEEKRPDDSGVSTQKNGGSDKGPESHSNAQTDSNVLETLMGNKDNTSSKKPSIEEMNE
ncbi:hypothetical protein BBP40_008567 [Aspergillus hancockii]|nr:hypothetical protein BBP40_008567 [Aspergillus hancockii]